MTRICKHPHNFTADFCMLPPEQGNCTLTLYKYFFSPEHDDCRMFVYGGCDGNDNMFDDKHSCIEICTGNYTDEEIKSQGVFLSSDKFSESTGK